jgi:hypothetical protein
MQPDVHRRASVSRMDAYQELVTIHAHLFLDRSDFAVLRSKPGKFVLEASLIAQLSEHQREGSAKGHLVKFLSPGGF